jgi:hypothetical protein
MAILPSLMKAKVMLKPEEIFAISEEISKNYTPLITANPAGLARRIALSSKELLDISQDITRKYTPKLNSGTPSFVLLPIDPDHLFVSWNLSPAKADISDMQAAPKEDRLLRIHPNRKEYSINNLQNNWFEIPLTPGETRQTIVVPEAYKAESYAAAIGIRDQENQFTVLATSKVTYNQPYDKKSYPSGGKGMSNGCQFQA